MKQIRQCLSNIFCKLTSWLLWYRFDLNNTHKDNTGSDELIEKIFCSEDYNLCFPYILPKDSGIKCKDPNNRYSIINRIEFAENHDSFWMILTPGCKIEVKRYSYRKYPQNKFEIIEAHDTRHAQGQEHDS